MKIKLNVFQNYNRVKIHPINIIEKIIPRNYVKHTEAWKGNQLSINQRTNAVHMAAVVSSSAKVVSKSEVRA